MKLRPAREERLAGRWTPGVNQDKDYRVEFDWAREPVLAASVDAKRDAADVTEIAPGDPLKVNVFTKKQWDFLVACGPRESIDSFNARLIGMLGSSIESRVLG